MNTSISEMMYPLVNTISIGDDNEKADQIPLVASIHTFSLSQQLREIES